MPRAKTRSVELHFEFDGPEDGPVVVLSNSLGTTCRMWASQVPALAERCRVLRYDTRGHGQSDVVDRPATIEDLADDLAGLLDALSIQRAHILGLSLGGMTGQAMAARHPTRVASLVVMATSSYMGAPDFWRARASLVRNQGMAAVVDVVTGRWFTPGFLSRHPDVVQSLRRDFLAIDPIGYAVCCEAIGGMDLRQSNRTITCPVLVLAGADDPATPLAMAEKIRDEIAGAQLQVIPNAAHLLNVEQPERVNHALTDWLGVAT